MPKLCQNRERVLERVLPFFVEHPCEQLSLQGIADGCGVSLWALRYNFSNVDGLFRAAALALIARVGEQAAFEIETGASAHEAIALFGRRLCGLFETDDYRDLSYFVLRNGRHHRWLEAAYDDRVVEPICRQLEALVLAVGRRRGTPIAFRPGAPRRFYKRLETEIVLSRLMPLAGDLPAQQPDAVLKALAREAFEATYVFDWSVSTAA